MRNRLWIGPLILALLFLAGCKAGIQEEAIYEMGPDYVVIAYETDGTGQIVPKGYDHPAKFTPEQIDLLLQKVKYSEYSFFKWRGEKALFVETERKKLCAHLSVALTKITPDQWVKFAVTANKRDLFLPTKKLTDGYLFVADGKVNLALSNMIYEMSEDGDPYFGDPRNRYTLPSLKILTGPGITAPPIDENSKFLRREHHNWVLLDPAVLMADPAPKETITPPETPETAQGMEKKSEEPTTKTLEEKLEELKALFDKGLISREDYERKKQELLESL